MKEGSLSASRKQENSESDEDESSSNPFAFMESNMSKKNKAAKIEKKKPFSNVDIN